MVDPGPKPHVGQPVMLHGSATVLIGGENAARVGDMCACMGPPDPIAKGSTGVFIEGQQAARLDDQTGHGGKITGGCPTVLIGDTASGSETGDEGASSVFALEAEIDDTSEDGDPDLSEGVSLTAEAASKDEGGALLHGHATAHPRGTSSGAIPRLVARIGAGTGAIRIFGTPGFRRRVLRALVRLNLAPAGRSLLWQLDASGRHVTIQESATSNDENATNFSDGLYDTVKHRAGPGSDSVVNWNPHRASIGREAWQRRDPAIGLGHELVHAYHDAYGTSDGAVSTYSDAAGHTRSVEGYEQQAVGLGRYSRDAYTENVLRSQFNSGHISVFGRELQRPHY